MSLSLVCAEAARAYTLSYYFGTPESPIGITNGVAGGRTCCYYARLYNEATASGSVMDRVVLTYNDTVIGTSIFTWYYIVYRNGLNVRAGCQITKSGPYTTWVYCDTTK